MVALASNVCNAIVLESTQVRLWTIHITAIINLESIHSIVNLFLCLCLLGDMLYFTSIKFYIINFSVACQLNLPILECICCCNGELEIVTHNVACSLTVNTIVRTALLVLGHFNDLLIQQKPLPILSPSYH